MTDALLDPDSPFLALTRALDDLVFVWRPSGEMLWVNDAFVRITGMTCEDFKFRNVDNPFIHPDDLPTVIAQIGAFLDSADRQSQPIENRFCDAWGSYHALSTVLHKVSWGGQPALLLVSRQRACAQPELVAAQNAQRSLMESVADGVLELDADGRILYVNRVFQAWLGVRAVELAKRPLVELLAAEDQSAARAALAAIAEGAAIARFEAVLHGTQRALDVKLSRLDSPQERKVALAIARDVTELKQLERSLQHAQHLESIGRLAGGVAHDFNNALTTIGGNIELALLELPTDDPVRELLGEAQRAARSAGSLTGQLLAYSRKQLIAPQVLSLNGVVQRLQRMLARVLGEDVELRTELAADLPAVCFDPGQLEQILVNLCLNARDAMPDGGVLQLRTSCVRDTAQLCERHELPPQRELVCLTVADTGLGIADDVQQQIFEPFFTTKGLHKGTGLGLAMVYGAMQQNGGCVEVDSQLGHGATFRLYFVADERPSAQPRAAGERAAPRGHERIAVVEDEPAVRQFAVKLLERLGYEVSAYGTGQQALSAIAREPGAIQLLMTDVVMPGMNGRELADRARALSPSLAVLFTSGYSEHVIERHGVLEPGIEFLPKPYSAQALADQIRKLLDRQR